MLQPNPTKRISAYELIEKLYSQNLINLDDTSVVIEKKQQTL